MKSRAILLVFAALGACGGTSAAQPDDGGASDDVGSPDDAGPADDGAAPDGACRAEDVGADATDVRETRCSPDAADAGDEADCPAGLSVCYGMPDHDPRCVDTMNDPAYCGCCGNVCTAPSCVAGICDECAEEPCGSWRPISAAGATARRGAPAVWTGTELVVWGGMGPRGDGTDGPLASGGAFRP